MRTYRRRNFLNLICISVVATCVAFSALAQGLPNASHPEATGLSLERLQRLTSAFQAEVDKGAIPGAVVLIARNGEAAYLKAFGFQDREKQVPMKTDAIFRIASMSKPITSVAAMMFFLVEGILFVVLGLGAILVPPLASLAVTIFLGWMFLISGVVGLALTFWARKMPGFWWSLFSAVLAIGAGIVLLARPVQGILTLTIVVGAYFIAEGVSTIMYALEHRRELSERWAWLLISGIVDLILAGLIISGLPGSAEWAIGLLVGINMLFGGFSLIGMALAARKG